MYTQVASKPIKSVKFHEDCFPLHFQKKMGLRGKFFFAKKMRIDNFGMIRPGRSGLFPTVSDRFRLFPTVSDCFRLFPTVSVSLERQLDLWTTDSTKITTFNTFPHDPSARRLLEMMHFDFETQYTLKIPKPQDLVKFNNQKAWAAWYRTCMVLRRSSQQTVQAK